jgi:hypothetical protein
MMNLAKQTRTAITMSSSAPREHLLPLSHHGELDAHHSNIIPTPF